MKSLSSAIATMSYDPATAILSVKILENAEMTLESTRDHYQKILSLVGSDTYFALIDASNYFSMEPEAFELASHPATVGNRMAAAHYNANMGNTLNTNYFSLHYKPPIPVRIFKDRQSALDWLLSLPRK